MKMNLSRRSALKFGAATAATLATPNIMIRAVQASNHSGTGMMNNAGKHGFKLGEFTVATLADGAFPVPDAHAIFGTNQPKDTVETLLVENYLPPERMLLSFTPTIIDTGSDLVLFDAGNGAGRREAGAGKLLASLPGAGVDPQDVTVVVITHMHPDHIGGLMENGSPAFPNARYVTGQVEYDFWTSEDRMNTPAEGVAKLVEANVKPLADRMTFLNDGDEVAPGISALSAFGHTPGHLAFMIESGGQRLAITADTANHFVLSLQQPDWEVSFDAMKDKAAQARRNIFGMLAQEKIPFIGYHMPFPSIGYVEPMGSGFRWIPETYQLDL